MFVGQSGKGAFLNGKKIKVSQNADLKDSLIAFGTNPYDRNNAKKTFDSAQRVFSSCQDLRRSGSAALDIAYVACGRIDGYFELTLQPWDFAGGLLILRECGGKITSWTGADLDVLASDSVLATNALIHEQIIGLMV